MVETVLFIIEIIGIISFSISGSIVAIDKETDLFGVVFLALMTCFGGGIIRDITIGITPPSFYVNMALYVIIGFATSLLVFILAAIFKKTYIERKEQIMTINNFIDALGLGIFAVMGTQICLEKCPEGGGFLAILMGMISGVGGGMIRDLILNDIPFILRKRIYAVAAISGAGAYYFLVTYILEVSPINTVIAKVIGISIVVIIRVLATTLKLNLPKIRFNRP